mgnify:CR=1 FL=1
MAALGHPEGAEGSHHLAYEKVVLSPATARALGYADPGALAVARQLKQDYDFDGIEPTLPATLFDERFVLDLEGSFVYANKATTDLFAMEIQAIVGKSTLDLGFSFASDLQRDLGKVIAEASTQRGKFVHTFASGRGERFEYLLAPVLDVALPDASFYLWAGVPARFADAAPGLSADEAFARDLLAQYNVTVLPGSYLARTAQGHNPGTGRVRMALVAEVDECLEAAQRIVRFLQP